MFEYHSGGVQLKVWIDQQAYYSDASLCQQAEAVSRHSAVFHHAAIMPDGHPGFGMPIGGVAAFEGMICPYGVGMDIGCGMLSSRLNLPASTISDRGMREAIKEAIKAAIPMGFSHRNSSDHMRGEAGLLPTAVQDLPGPISEVASKDAVLRQCGTLGGGNHFIEFQADEQGGLWLTIHSGSRNVGAQVCRRYHDLAVEACKAAKTPIPCKELAVLAVDSVEGKRYIEAMNFCLQFALDNRQVMAHDVLQAIRRMLKGAAFEESINIHHNYAALESHFGHDVWVHRKGATSALAGQLGIIPGSMGTSSYIVRGRGNPESFQSCSHGGGRLMSRSKAKNSISMTMFKEAMGDVVCDFDPSILDESPAAYKNIETVMGNQTDLVEVVHTLRPLIAIKAVKCKEE